MVTSVVGSVWYLGNGASFHMTENKEVFSELEDKDLQMHIEMGDDGRYNMIGIDTITFQRDSGSPLTLKYVMHVPGLNKNLISHSMLEDDGYSMIFSKGKAFLHHIASIQVKRIRVWVKKLYKLDVEDCATLSIKVKKV